MQTTKILDIAAEVVPPADGIVSRTLHNDAGLKAVIFGFGAGQELSEHTASMPAVMHFLKGEATVTLGDERVEARPGTWIHMQAGQLHTINAQTPTTMLLLLMKGQR
jgi:quercetin dioxygenase-like cupin family protein